MMCLVLIFLCIGIVSCEELTVTVTPATVTPATSNSTSSVVIENKVQNLTVKYNSDHGKNTSYIVSTPPSNQTTEKPIIITTSKEIRLIQTPHLNDSIAVATAISKNNSTLRHPNDMKHHGRASQKKYHSNHFLPTVRPESTTKFANLSKYASPSKAANVTKVATPNGNVNLTRSHINAPKTHNGQQQSATQYSEVRHPVARHVYNVKPQTFINYKAPKKNVSQTEIEMEKVEVREVRFVENPKGNKKFRYYMVADENADKKPSMSSQTFEMTFPTKSVQRNPNIETKSMDKYKVRSKAYSASQNYQNPTKLTSYPTTAALLQYMTPPAATIYTVRPKTTNVDNISITTAVPPLKKLNTSNQLGVKVQSHSGPRDFSCLRCSGSNKPHKNYKYPSYPTKQDMLEGHRAIKLLGPDGDNFLGGSKNHYVVAKPEGTTKTIGTSSNQKGQTPVLQGSKRPETHESQVKQTHQTSKQSEKSKASVIATRTPKHPGHNSKLQTPTPKQRTYVMGGLGSYASQNAEHSEIFSFPETPSHSLHRQKENFSSKPQSTQKTRNPYFMDGLTANHPSSNVEFSVTRSNVKNTASPFKLDPSTGLYNLDDELKASASSSIYKHHGDVRVETKEIHIPVPEIIETRVPYPIHIKVDRLVPVHIDKPYPVHVEKKVPVPVKINVPHPYPVEKEVPYPVKIPIEVPRPVQVDKPVPYLVENPVPIQVFKKVKVPVKVPVDVPKPYKVHVQVEKRVPFFVEKKVPFEVPVPVEKPYLVEVKKPFEVPQEKPQPVTVEKKIPVPVQVVEFVKVPIPVHSPDQHRYQHRSGEMDAHNENVAQSTHLVEHKPNTHSADQTMSSTDHRPSKMQVVLPHMISVEFPADFARQPTGPASGFLPTASDAQVTQK